MKEAFCPALTSDCRAGGWRENEEKGASGCTLGGLEGAPSHPLWLRSLTCAGYPYTAPSWG